MAASLLSCNRRDSSLRCGAKVLIEKSCVSIYEPRIVLCPSIRQRCSLPTQGGRRSRIPE
jgi:hypothetical protein